ncbi:hypothetical protein DMI66_01175 [Escherichia coli]|nr:hypothetical protein [Escherichia coli]
MCAVRGVGPAFLARLWAEEGIFFFERFAADSPEQKLTLCDDVAGCHRRGASV